MEQKQGHANSFFNENGDDDPRANGFAQYLEDAPDNRLPRRAQPQDRVFASHEDRLTYLARCEEYQQLFLSNALSADGRAPAVVQQRCDFYRSMLADLEEQRQTILKSIADHSQASDGDQDYFYRWPPSTSARTKVRYLDQVGLIGKDSSQSRIAKFLLTFESLCTDHDGDFFTKVEEFFPRAKMRARFRLVELNLLFALCLDVQDLNETPFRTYDEDRFDAYVTKLINHLRFMYDIRDQLRYIIEKRNANMAPAPLVRLPPFNHASEDEDADCKKKAVHYLLEHYLTRAGMDQLRRSEDAVYEPVFTDIYHTRHYKYLDDFPKWIAWNVDSKLYPYMHHAYCEKMSIPDHICKLLSNLPDPRFPFLRPERTLFSYRNGIFDASSGCFHLYANNADQYSSTAVRNVDELDSSLTTANFFDVEVNLAWFDDGKDFDPFDDIYTPVFDSVLDTQRFSRKEKWFFYMMLGRLVFEVGDKEDWQLALYLQGCAGSGKSSLYRAFSTVFPANRIGYLSDDMEKTFSDQHIHDKWIVFCLDVTSKFGMSASKFNSYVSGETVVINRKFKTALMKIWSAQLAFLSNVDPPIESRAGSGARRFLGFLFPNMVRNTDTKMLEKLKAEVPVFLIRACSIYLQAVALYGHCSLWDDRNTLPEMCWKQREAYLAATSPLVSFFTNTDLVQFDPNFYEPVKAVITAFRNHVASFDLKKKVIMSRSATVLYLNSVGCMWYNPRKDELPEQWAGIYVDPEHEDQNRIYGLRLVANHSASQ